MKRLAGLVCALFACGGRVAQSVECKTYVACVRALDLAQGRTTNMNRFLPDGVCWGNAPTGELCETGCRRGVEWLRAHETVVPKECGS